MAKKKPVTSMKPVKWWGVVDETGIMYDTYKTDPGTLERQFIKHIGHRLVRVEIKEIKR